MSVILWIDSGLTTSQEKLFNFEIILHQLLTISFNNVYRLRQSKESCLKGCKFQDASLVCKWCKVLRVGESKLSFHRQMCKRKVDFPDPPSFEPRNKYILLQALQRASPNFNQVFRHSQANRDVYSTTKENFAEKILRQNERPLCLLS